MLLLLRALGLAAPAAAAGGYAARRAWAMPAPGTADFATLLTELAAWVLVAGCSWALCLVAAAAIEAGSHGRLRPVRLLPCPEVARRWAFALLGAAVLSTTPVTAHADPGRAPRSRTAIGGLPLPDRPDGSVPGGPAGRAARGAPPVVVVQPGDSLWGLVSHRLPDSTDAAAVAAAVSATYRANRPAIGPDPDLVRPGQRLVLTLRPERLNPSQEDR